MTTQEKIIKEMIDNIYDLASQGIKVSECKEILQWTSDYALGHLKMIGKYLEPSEREEAR